MSPRAKMTAAVLTALLIAGCSGNKPPVPQTSAPADPPSAAAAPNVPPPSGPQQPPAGAGQLAGGTCLQLTGAVVNLISGSSPEDAGKAADTIKGFNPPENVVAAVTHFVGTNGLHTTDPNRTQYSRAINDWVEKQCPVNGSPNKPK